MTYCRTLGGVGVIDLSEFEVLFLKRVFGEELRPRTIWNLHNTSRLYLTDSPQAESAKN